jgi:hypothetical protein
MYILNAYLYPGEHIKSTAFRFLMVFAPLNKALRGSGLTSQTSSTVFLPLNGSGVIPREHILYVFIFCIRRVYRIKQ